jgi:hypothetical protein
MAAPNVAAAAQVESSAINSNVGGKRVSRM